MKGDAIMDSKFITEHAIPDHRRFIDSRGRIVANNFEGYMENIVLALPSEPLSDHEGSFYELFGDEDEDTIQRIFYFNTIGEYTVAFYADYDNLSLGVRRDVDGNGGWYDMWFVSPMGLYNTINKINGSYLQFTHDLKEFDDIRELFKLALNEFQLCVESDVTHVRSVVSFNELEDFYSSLKHTEEERTSILMQELRELSGYATSRESRVVEDSGFSPIWINDFSLDED